MSEIKYTVNVSLWFHPSDAKRLRELAAFSDTRKAEDRELFRKAASATENSSPLVIQVMSKDKLAEIINVFRYRGIQHAPLVEELVPTPRGGLNSRVWSG